VSTYATVTPIPSVPSVDALTYHVPDGLGRQLASGMRVLVPLGRRRVTGIITALDVPCPDGVACRDIGEVLDSEPVLGPELIELARWMSTYYMAPLADVISLAIGRGLTTASQRMVALVDAALARTDVERALVEALAQAGGRLATGKLRRRLDGRSIDAALAALCGRGAVTVDERLDQPAVRERFETYVSIGRPADEALVASLFTRAPKRKQIYEYLMSQPGRRVSLMALAEVFPAPTSQLGALEQAGVVVRTREEVYRELAMTAEQSGGHELSAHQTEAVSSICETLGGFTPFLLQGVTASGKTEVYLRVIARALERGGSALVLVPEISLTHQIVARLVGRFGPTVAVLHSELSAGERWDQWRRISRGEARIAVGARSAVLAPLADLQVVVVDEEHDTAYKQEDGVRYHGRDVAIVRARMAGCPVVLGSATPSIESRQRATEERYHRLLLPDRVTRSPLPAVEVVDLRGRDIVATGGLSDHLGEQLLQNFGRGGQSLLFLNRRGYAANLQCYECGEIVECTACSVGMTLHRDQNRLHCHHCDARRGLPERCPGCSADSLLGQGLGTQRLESAVVRLLPEARVERLDRDTARRKGVTRSVLADWRSGRIDVLIGTQMIAKGHDAPGVTLVGVVQADLGLGVPDFRSAERTFQLLTQVAGRAGRGEERGRVIFQTYRPDHPAVAAAAHHDYESFAGQELIERVELAYPPYTRMVLLRFDGRVREQVEAAAAHAASLLEKLARTAAARPTDADRAGDDDDGIGLGDALTVRGPAPSPIERVKDRFRFQVQLRCRHGALVRHAAAECRRVLAADLARAHVRMSIDVDPVDML